MGGPGGDAARLGQGGHSPLHPLAEGHGHGLVSHCQATQLPQAQRQVAVFPQHPLQSLGDLLHTGLDGRAVQAEGCGDSAVVQHVTGDLMRSEDLSLTDAKALHQILGEKEHRTTDDERLA